MSPPRLIVDTDPGHDDALALILAHRYADIVGVTSVAGNTSLEHTTRNAQSVCALFDPNIPVHSGSAEPLKATPHFATEVHGADGLGGIAMPKPTQSLASERAVDFLLDAVESDVWVVAIGPLTNIAHVISRDKTWPQRIAGLSVMGGTTKGGNVTPSAEFNIYFDPEAASVVFNAVAGVKMSGLNLTQQVQVTDADLDDIASGERESELTRFVNENFNRMLASLERLTGKRQVAMHDPVAILAVTHPELFVFQRRHVEVELAGAFTRGMTVVDERFGDRAQAGQVEVGYEADVASVKQVIFEGLYSM